MMLLVYYILILLVFNVMAVFLGFVVEGWWGSHASMLVFLAIYFLTLWLAWVIAVWLTKPKVVVAKAAGIVPSTPKG